MPVITEEQYELMHYGVLRKSGRYPWGSGETRSQRNRDFISVIREQKRQGQTDAEIARDHGMTVLELRARRSRAIDEAREEQYHTVRRLEEKGMSTSAIGRQMGLNESSVRAIRARGEKDQQSALKTTTNMLRDQVDEKKMVDVGAGVEKMVGVNRTRFDTALASLKDEGYSVYTIQGLQVTTGKYTKTKILADKGIPLKQVQQNRGDIRLIDEHSIDQGRSFIQIQPPVSVSSRRIKVNYGPDGGNEQDGMIYIRPGVKDLTIGESRYGQVRIMVDKTHFLKGMAVYKEDLPDGVDIVFNTKAHDTGRKKDAMKPLKEDEDMPFGSIIRQVPNPNGKGISAINLVGSPTKEGSGEEGSWDKWSTNLSSQMLSKQSPKLATQQLDLTYDRRIRELNEINSITNPTVRKQLLLDFADSTDSSASHLEAAALPRTATKVLLPVPSMKPGEIYAPHLNDGERVVLIRHPHGGTFEIPELTVNNRNREARRIMGSNPEDSVGIHHKVAERLSGADFDGDTVLVIPNNRKSVESTPALNGLKGFDTQVYKIPKGSSIPVVHPSTKQHQMGIVSNLITDMTLKGADTDQLARAIRHSMVVIDSEKHQLNWKQSEKDHGIVQLREEYQGRHARGQLKGASTLISRAGAAEHLPVRVERRMSRGGPIDPATGKKVYELTGRMKPVTRTVTDPVTGRKKKIPTGAMEPVTEKHRRLSVTEDAFTLSSGRPMEIIYATHSNKLKALANDARKTALPLKGNKKSSTAEKVYSKEVESLNAKLNVAERNAPYERHAQRLANLGVSQKRQANPGMEKSEADKIKQQELNTARIRTGAKKTRIKITQSEWDAIQAGAVSPSKLDRILRNSEPDSVKRLALPKTIYKMTSAKVLRARRMLDDGYTQAEVADAFGIGVTTLKVAINE